MKIYIAHVGLNLNNAVFSKNSLVSMIPSLSGIPIVGYIEKDNFNDTDFTGHEEKIEIVDDEVTLTYLGRAYGFIGEDHNARFEVKNVDGREVEFLVCEGKIWNKFKESADIFHRDEIKGQSMELVPSSVKGKFQKDGHYYFETAMFEAACILGDKVNPAMKGSTISKFSTEFQEAFVNEIKNYQTKQKGGNKLTGKELKDKLVAAIPKDYSYAGHVESDNILVGFKDKFVGFKYTISENEVNVTEEGAVNYSYSWVAQENDEQGDLIPKAFSEKTITDLKTEHSKALSKLNQKVTEYETKFTKIENEQREQEVDALFTSFSQDLTEDEMSELKDKATDMTVDDIQVRLYALVGQKKSKAKLTDKQTTVKFTFDKSKSNDKTMPAWAELMD